MKLALLHARTMTAELVRYPAYLVPTLLLPTVFFLFFVSPGPPLAATARMATFAGFAVIGVAFFQFGVGIAVDRASPWEAYLRTLPVGPLVRLTARLLSAVVFACAAGALLAGHRGHDEQRLAPCRALARAFAGAPRRNDPVRVPRDRARVLGSGEGSASDREPALPRPRLCRRPLDQTVGLPHAVRGVSRLLPTRALSDALVATAIGARTDWRRVARACRVRRDLRVLCGGRLPPRRGTAIHLRSICPTACRRCRTRRPRLGVHF